MAVTSTDIQLDTIYRMLENGAADATANTLMTDMFSPTEIMDSMDRIYQKFLLDTGMIVKRVAISGVVGTGQYAMPIDAIRPRRVTWTDSAGATRTLTQVDTWELDHGASDWPSDSDTPLAWYENTLDQQQLGIAKTPSNDGGIGLL